MKIGLVGTGRIGAFHAKTLLGLDFVDELLVTDVNETYAAQVAGEIGATHVRTLDDLLASGLDGFVITTGTATHAELIRRGIAAGIPTFCEKPVAATVAETADLARLEAESGVPVHIGFQRRLDAAYRRIRDAVQSGELGFVHTIRCVTNDQAPPDPAFIPTSGGIFRDCNVHDFDAIRFVTGREVDTVYAVGANKGASFFTEGGDVDTAAALLTLDDGTLCSVGSTRYNGGGHDVRMEVHGELGSLAAGLDDSFPFTSAEPGVTWPPGPRKWSFMERFLPAYVAELTAFAEVAAGRMPPPATIADGLEAFRVAEACELSKREQRMVRMSEIPGA